MPFFGNPLCQCTFLLLFSVPSSCTIFAFRRGVAVERDYFDFSYIHTAPNKGALNWCNQRLKKHGDGWEFFVGNRGTFFGKTTRHENDI